MNYEEKYKEALELARDYYKANLMLNKADENLILEDIFPELAESDDERIKKAIKKALQVKCCDYGYRHRIISDESVTLEEALAWLEKQGEPKTELATEDEIYWLAWAIGRLPDTEKADESESVLKELFEKLKKMKGGDE